MNTNDSYVFLFSRLQEELNRLVTEFMEQGKGEIRQDGWSPNVDVLETPEAVEIIAEVPGMKASDLELEVAGNIVTLTGRKKTAYTSKGQVRFERVERAQGDFRRQLSLDRPVNGSQAHAVLRGGLLKVSFPKIEDKRRQVRYLEIESD